MRKIVLNVISVLILSICVSSCSKNDKDESTPATQKDVAGEWVMSVDPVISITINAGSQGAEYQQKAKEQLQYLFQKGDKYLFKNDLSVEITRGSSIAPYPTSYKIDGSHLTFDGYIKFISSISSDKLTLKAGDAEIRDIIKVELVKEKYGFDAETINSILNFVTGDVNLTFTR
ncbi:MAG: hypothetical protein LBS43_02840 [Prevotellaceae bacterium]|jgi:hypothetical protein|nr:hypothetical protein [Prevotellaceae bacterium]